MPVTPSHTDALATAHRPLSTTRSIQQAWVHSPQPRKNHAAGIGGRCESKKLWQQSLAGQNGSGTPEQRFRSFVFSKSSKKSTIETDDFSYVNFFGWVSPVLRHSTAEGSARGAPRRHDQHHLHHHCVGVSTIGHPITHTSAVPPPSHAHTKTLSFNHFAIFHLQAFTHHPPIAHLVTPSWPCS
jgi:hypothetical protein